MHDNNGYEFTINFKFHNIKKNHISGQSCINDSSNNVFTKMMFKDSLRDP